MTCKVQVPTLTWGPNQEDQEMPQLHFSTETWTLEAVSPGLLLEDGLSHSSALTYPCLVCPFLTVAPSTLHPPQFQGVAHNKT